jgi:hypothetical protein
MDELSLDDKEFRIKIMKYLFAMTVLCKQTSLKEKREHFVFIGFLKEVSI